MTRKSCAVEIDAQCNTKELPYGVLPMCTVCGVICRYNWIADYTIIMLVRRITCILKVSRGPLANQNAESEYNVKQ